MSIIAEYIWIDGNASYRSKYKTISQKNEIWKEPWNYDGSSTDQATTEKSEIFLHPVYTCIHPFLENSIIVLCDTYIDFECTQPAKCNYRYKANQMYEKYKQCMPTFGFEQEYFFMSYESDKQFSLDSNKKHWKIEHFHNNFTNPQGPYYCGNGGQIIIHRDLALKHYKACLTAGLKISGLNAEVAPSQWEFQIGPVIGIQSGDQLHVARFLLERIAEMDGKKIEWKPKPLKSPWNGSGLHTNFSTMKTMDAKNGYMELIKSIEHAGLSHKDDLTYYGDNSERLCGSCETSNKDNFTYGVADRKASVRIPTQVEKQGFGYLEDRRPASDADPYHIIERMVQAFIVL